MFLLLFQYRRGRHHGSGESGANDANPESVEQHGGLPHRLRAGRSGPTRRDGLHKVDRKRSVGQCGVR